MPPSRLGRYEILREIATGGMAKVYLGRVVGEGGFERLVAVKVMHPHLDGEPEFVAMFLDEARLAARIRHPNVVPTIDVQKGEQGLFLVMDYIEGPSLRAIHRLLKREKRAMPVEIAVRVLLDVLSGLHAAHELRDQNGEPLHLVHRDVSPHNVLVGTDGIARLTDFGVARAEARISSTASGQLKGKLPYMAPEQLLGRPVDRRTDVYAAGVVLWELCTGKTLFKADSEGALVHMIVAGASRAPNEIEPRVPPAVAAVCMRALSTDAEQRFATAEDFGEALEHAAHVGLLDPARPRAVATFVRELAPSLQALEGPGPASVSSKVARKTSPEAAPIEPLPSVAPPDTGTRHDAVLAGPPERSRRGVFAVVVAVAVAAVVAIGALVYGGGDAAHEPAPAAEPRADATAISPPEGAGSATGDTTASPPDPSTTAKRTAPPRRTATAREKTPPAPPPPPKPTEFRPKGL
jgi:serine/threonine-protein kinase